MALSMVEEIIVYLQNGGSVIAAEQPFRIYLTCYQVLKANHDPRAMMLLQIVYSQLQAQAGKIPDEENRRKLLENVPWHREIVALYTG